MKQRDDMNADTGEIDVDDFEPIKKRWRKKGQPRHTIEVRKTRGELAQLGITIRTSSGRYAVAPVDKYELRQAPRRTLLGLRKRIGQSDRLLDVRYHPTKGWRAERAPLG